MSPTKTVLILGGGVGGVVAANTLRKRLPRSYRIVVIERRSHHLFQPSLLWMLIGERRRDQIERPLKQLTKKNIDVIHGDIEKIDPTEQTVQVNGEVMRGDWMIVALGADLATEKIPGMSDTGPSFYTPEGAENIWRQIKDMKKGRVVVLTGAPAYKCPAAPYEAAMLLDGYFRRDGRRGQIAIDIYAAEPGPMGVTGTANSAAVRQMVEAKNIGYFPQHQIESIDPQTRQCKFTNGVTASYDVLLYVPPHKAPNVLVQAGLTGENGWVAVDRATMQTRFDRVWALGDATAIALKNGKMLPKAGAFAHSQAEAIANTIADSIRGTSEVHVFNGMGSCFLETGAGRAGFGSGNFYAEPEPDIAMREPSRMWHMGKILFEKSWWWKWF